MDTPARAALGGALISTLAIGGMVAAGVLATSAALVASDPVAPPAHADGLVRFADCDSLRDWYVQHTLDRVGPYGWGGDNVPMMTEDLARMPSSDSAAKGAVSNGPTGTNTQETDVDEPDIAKTDGRLVVRVRDGRRLVVTEVTGGAPRQLSDWRLPPSTYADSLLLVGDHVLLSSSATRMLGREGFFPGGRGSTDVYDVDISDPAHPRLAERHTWSGQQLSMRQYGDTVRLVTTIGLPQLRFVQPGDGILSEHQAERRNKEIVRSSRIDEWIPGLSCDEVYHPLTWSGPDTVAVWTFRPGSTADATKVGVTGAGSEVYSSSDRLYVTSTDWGNRVILRAGPDTTVRSDRLDRRLRPKTYIHAFALDGDTTRYVASGTVNGTIKDRWSLDEQDGHLRVAVSWLTDGLEPADNGIAVFDERGDRLEQVGTLRGLGVGEQLQSVRWFDDLAVLVTFRQTDPLYTVDLGDPTRPRQLGALKIPGFSSYLHPIGDDRLLGIGSDATDTGRQLGAQAAVFDIADTSDVHQVGKVTFGTNSWLEAADDPHAFTWLPAAHAAVTSVQDGSRTSMVVLRVGADGSLSTHELGSVGGWGARALPLADGRVALVGDRVRIVDLS
ncbi:beta-propeller domain-containing protein [Marmoricola sp. URHB0036]|uniref:beta-propeller domain-containing protein n=1 Tax=Marmoricola sp. URHB0036 TaxID=1298863 RepID=UPI0003F9504A|nr:beta-propeller domain-containing protein [Marmoricola sp. URHB0036]